MIATAKIAIRQIKSSRFPQSKFRLFSSSPTVDRDQLTTSLQNLIPSIASSLTKHGFYSTPPSYPLLPPSTISLIRSQSIKLRAEGRFEQSISISTTSTGDTREFNKPGVFACEPDGADYETAPDLLVYMSTVISTLPSLINENIKNLNISYQAFNAKLAITSPGGSVYPLHVDNNSGLEGNPPDLRKLTAILYLGSVDYDEKEDGGELRLLTTDDNDELKTKTCTFPPSPGRFVIFYSDSIPHEVLPTSPNHTIDDVHKDRYALTIWLPVTDTVEGRANIYDMKSKFYGLKDAAFNL